MNSTKESPARAAGPSADGSALAGIRHSRKARRLAKPVIITLAVLAIGGWLAHTAWHAYYYEGTDDAYVVGHLHQVSAQVDGQVKSVHVDDNQLVAAGDVLVELDPLAYEIARQKAEAGVAQAQAQQAEADAAAQQAAAQLATAQARSEQAGAEVTQTKAQLELARITLNRNESLFKNGGAVTQSDLDNARSTFNATQAAADAAESNLTAAKAGIAAARAAQTSANAQITAAKANVAAAQAALRDAARELADTRIVAPAAGRIGNRNVEVGNRVKAGQNLFALAESDYWITANFKETQLAQMHPGQQVEFTIDALPGRELHGTIDSISPASGAQFALLPPDNATGNFNKVVQRVPVKITIDPNTLKEIGDKLRLGLSVIVDVRVR